ncbi:MAG: cysteine desulfurase [Pirellulaceae bacterium]|jgi:cysteine desulfurase
MDRIFLDHNSTTAIDPEVAAAIFDCFRQQTFNPASQHWGGREARRWLDNLRVDVGQMLGANVDEISGDRLVFTSGGTESNNLALLGIAGESPGRIVVSSIEHPSVIGAAEELQRRGFDVQHLPALATGVVDLTRLPDLITEETKLVSVMMANNETGVLQPIAEIAQLCRSRAVPFHTDATQAVGKLPVNFRDLQVAALSFTAHKIHGPRGVGGLLLRDGLQVHPQLHGGFQQEGIRPGTESVALVVGLHAALKKCIGELESRRVQLEQLRDQFEQTILAHCSNAKVIGAAAERLPQTSNISFRGLDRQAALMALDLQKIACSTGSACASGSSDPSPVLIAMGLSDELIEGALRFSFGIGNTSAEIDAACSRVLKVVHGLLDE